MVDFREITVNQGILGPCTYRACLESNEDRCLTNIYNQGGKSGAG